jgi:beta-mannosidase
VWHGSQKKYQEYPVIGGRFNSEFGIACLSNLPTIKYFVTNESEMYPQSRTLDFHNKADGHERRIATYVVENFRIDPTLEVCSLFLNIFLLIEVNRYLRAIFSLLS